MSQTNVRKIKFNFHPYQFADMKHYVEKEDKEGIKRKYLVGVASGMKTDGQGERMTKSCVEKMHTQANSGDLLIYDSPHGVAGTDDVGIIIKSEVTPLGEWLIEARLYDTYDGFKEDSFTLQKIDKLWKQLKGLPPYKKPAQKGFSVEGYIPEGGIELVSENGKRVIDDIVLKGAIVTSDPAYTDSIINAIYKALDELKPEKKQVLEKDIYERFADKLKSGDYGHNFYLQYYTIQDVLQDLLEEYLRHPRQLDDKLNSVFEQYKKIMVELLKRNINMFQNKSAQEIEVRKDNRMRMLYLKVAEQFLIQKIQHKERMYDKPNRGNKKIPGNNSKTITSGN